MGFAEIPQIKIVPGRILKDEEKTAMREFHKNKKL